MPDRSTVYSIAKYVPAVDGVKGICVNSRIEPSLDNWYGSSSCIKVSALIFS